MSRLAQLITRSLAGQRFAVLATQHDGQPYASLVAFAETTDLSSIMFVTGRNTRKYSYASSNDRVALLVDTRSGRGTDLEEAVAITALGRVREVIEGERERLASVYVSKHPALSDFACGKDNALMVVRVDDYLVAGFRDTRSLHIGSPSSTNQGR